jgi:hypothetical protein
VNQPSIWDQIREWLGVLFCALTALFAGLVWWLARRSLGPQIELIFQQRSGAVIAAELRVNNRSRATVVVDELRPLHPSDVKIWSRLPVAATAPMMSQRREYHEGAGPLTVLTGDKGRLELTYVTQQAEHIRPDLD